MIPVDLMAPTTVAELPIDDGWAFEPKWDGYRAAAMVVGEVQVMSRRHRPDRRVPRPDRGPA